MKFDDIMVFAREQKDSIVDEMRKDIGYKFVSRINQEEFNVAIELEALKIEESGLDRAGQILEEVLEKMEKRGA